LPELANVNWKFWFESNTGDENTLSLLVTVCGMSSLFVQRTVDPALTVSSFGVKEKLSMAAWTVSPAAQLWAGSVGWTGLSTSGGQRRGRPAQDRAGFFGGCAGQRGVHHRKMTVSGDVTHIGQAEDTT
jgi:hypothetical protein